MKQDTPQAGSTHVPQWHPPAAARERLDRIIERFVEKAAIADCDPTLSCDALALNVTAGLGKTATALRVIAERGRSLLARGHVLIYMPTLDLAERAHQEFLELAPNLPSCVIRGREAPRSDDPSRQMCARADLAKKIAGFVPSVTQALCRNVDADGVFVQAPCASECPYLAQKDIATPHVVFLSHAYLTAQPPLDPECHVALRVVDEKVWQNLTRISRLAVEDFMRAPPERFQEGLRDPLSEVKARVVDALQRSLPLHDHVRQNGLSTETLEDLAAAERKAREHMEIDPGQDRETIEFRLATFDARAFLTSRRREKVLFLLSEQESGHCNHLKLQDSEIDGVARQAIEMFAMEEIPRDAPLLLLDADADPDITEKIVPGADFVTIQSPPVADIVQVSDRTLSDTWLLDEKKGKVRRSTVLSILEREVGRAAGRGVLVVATKAVLAALHEDVAGSKTLEDSALRKPLLGAVPRWFGPRTQGVNDFAQFASIVVIGRLQPRISDMEASAQAVFGGDALPIVHHDAGPLPAQEALHLMSDGSECSARSCRHPDPRVHTILAQTRECGTLQAIARLRLVAPERSKRVVILSNLPLPGFPITRLATLDALARGLEHEPDPEGYTRMETALCAIRDRPVRGTRLSANGLATDLPRDFATVGAARRFRRCRTTEHLVALCKRIARRNRWPLTQFILRKPGGGKPTPAVLLSEGEVAEAQAAVFWPGLNATRDG